MDNLVCFAGVCYEVERDIVDQDHRRPHANRKAKGL
jgi:hypothetical protein